MKTILFYISNDVISCEPLNLCCDDFVNFSYSLNFWRMFQLNKCIWHLSNGLLLCMLYKICECLLMLLQILVASIWYQNPSFLLKFFLCVTCPIKRHLAFVMQRSGCSWIFSIMQRTLLHLYEIAYVKLGSMMQISHVDLRTLQIYLFIEMPYQFPHLKWCMCTSNSTNAWWNPTSSLMKCSLYIFMFLHFPCVMWQEQGLCILICISVGKNL
jgi:hypothetical protein